MDLSWVSWGLPLPNAIQLAWIHVHLVLSNDYPKVLDLIFSEFTLGWLEVEVIVV